MLRPALLLLLPFSACARLPQGDVVAQFPALHAAAYQVYGLGDDRDALWTLLSGSFAGEALTRAYVEDWTMLQRLGQQGSAVEIDGVSHQRVEVIDQSQDGTRLRVEWTVAGTVAHLGHSHQRTHRYEAIFTVEEGASGPRIVDTRIKNGARTHDDRPASDAPLRTPLDLLQDGDQP